MELLVLLKLKVQELTRGFLQGDKLKCPREYKTQLLSGQKWIQRHGTEFLGAHFFTVTVARFVRVILILMKVGILTSTWFQNVPFCSLISEQFLFSF